MTIFLIWLGGFVASYVLLRYFLDAQVSASRSFALLILLVTFAWPISFVVGVVIVVWSVWLLRHEDR